MIVKTASNAPAPPNRCPVAPLVDDMASFDWLDWNSLLMAWFSTASPEKCIDI